VPPSCACGLRRRGYPASMQEHEIVSAVARSARIADHDAAERAVRATLSTLGSRLGRLPAGQPLADVLRSEGPAQRFGVDDFYRRVAAAEGPGCTIVQARGHARATLAALKAGVTGSEYDHLAARLPAEYADLLGTAPAHH
jgi:uncharacterized protein (DUF2267 family)